MPYFFIWGLRDLFIKFRFQRFTTWLSNQKILCTKRTHCIKRAPCTKRTICTKRKLFTKKVLCKKRTLKTLCIFSFFSMLSVPTDFQAMFKKILNLSLSYFLWNLCWRDSYHGFQKSNWQTKYFAFNENFALTRA